MKFLKYIYSIIALALLSSCTEEIISPRHEDVKEGEAHISLDISLNIAEMRKAGTRALGDKPDYSKLKLYVFEFEGVDMKDPLSNPLSENYTDSIENYEVAQDGDLHFNLTLRKYDDPRILHFIATEDQNLQFTPGYEGYMIPGIQVDNSTPAYWHRVEFPNGYGEYDTSGENFTTDVKLKEILDHVPMISNFAKISLTSTAPNFTFEGFALINQPTKGTVCPWDVYKSKFPDFLNGSSILTYDEINKDYNGYWPFNATATQNITNKNVEAATYDTEAKYIYERPNSSLFNPVVIMKGRRAQDGESTYYKLDLGRKNAETGLFEYYNILRNFEYNVRVTSVGAKGYDTAQEAMNGVVYNNFSFDVNTRNMLNVSDSKNMLWVNKTTFVVTQEDQTEIELLFRYKKEIGTNGGTLSNDDIKVIVNPGDAIENVEENVEYGTTDDTDGWRSVKIKTVNPDGDRKSGSVVIYDPATGLGRTISIVVRNPWLYTDAGVWGGNYNYYDQFMEAGEEGTRQPWEGYVSSDEGLGQPLTVRFHIPDDIPESLFPITFTFESDRQNIENNKVGNLTVEYGPSYFDPTQRTIKYTKTVTWANYNSELTKEDELGTIVDDDNDGITSHVVRARFQTIAPIVTGEKTMIRVYNPYMRVSTDAESQYLEVSFRGKEGKAPDYAPEDDPTPSE